MMFTGATFYRDNKMPYCPVSFRYDEEGNPIYFCNLRVWEKIKTGVLLSNDTYITADTLREKLYLSLAVPDFNHLTIQL